MQTYLQIQESFTKKSESCVLVGYVHGDATPTRGWGHTGPEVRAGQVITQAQADYDFIADQAKADAGLKRLCKPAALAALAEHQKAALLDFVFNAGENSAWTIWKDVNASNLADVPAQLERFIWVHPNGPNKPAVTSNGLKNRRAAEKTLWNTADVAASIVVACAGGQTCSSATRDQLTPPTPSAPKSFSRTSFGLKIAGFFAGSSGLATRAFTSDTQARAQNVADTVTAHASSFGHFGSVLTSVCGAGVVVIAAGALLVHVTQQEAAKV